MENADFILHFFYITHFGKFNTDQQNINFD
jgi:hypothetical protein